MPIKNCCLPSASTRMKPLATAVADPQHTPKGVQGRDQNWGTLCSGKNWQNRTSDSWVFFRRFYELNFLPSERKVEMVVWHHWLYGNKFGKTHRDTGGQRSLVCCSPWGRRESDTTERLKITTKGTAGLKHLKAARIYQFLPFRFSFQICFMF